MDLISSTIAAGDRIDLPAIDADATPEFPIKVVPSGLTTLDATNFVL